MKGRLYMSQLRDFLKQLPEEIFQPGEIILAKGQVAKCLFVPIRGIVKVHDLDRFGIERRILSVQKYEVFPNGWLSSPGTKVQYTYSAFTKVKCVRVDQATLNKLAAEYPKALMELMALSDHRLAYANERIEMLVQGRAEDKVLHFLKYLYERMSKPAKQNGMVVFTSKMTQKEIGESLGLTRETTSRILREFASKGILKLGPKQQLFIVEAKLLSQF